MRIGQFFLTFFTFLFCAVRGWHNITYNSTDTALIYQPTRWSDWPANGCLSWPIGQYTIQPGTITLYFEGVAVYAYGLFDDSSNPIYTVSVDEDTPTKLGLVSPTTANRCEPLYSKTQMAWSKHRVIFNITNERPTDVRDLSFQGFIVTVPDPGDGMTFDTTIPYPSPTSTATTSTSTSTSSSSSSSSNGFAQNLTKILSTVGTIIVVVIAAACVCGCIRGCCCSGARRPRSIPQPLFRNQQVPLQNVANASNNAFQPPPPPYEPATRAVPNMPSPFSPFTPTPAPVPPPAPNPPPIAPMFFSPPEAPAHVFSPPTPPPQFEPHKAQFSGIPTTLAESSKGMDTKHTSSSSTTPVYNPTFPMPAHTADKETANPVAPAFRSKSPAWHDSSEALD